VDREPSQSATPVSQVSCSCRASILKKLPLSAPHSGPGKHGSERRHHRQAALKTTRLQQQHTATGHLASTRHGLPVTSGLLIHQSGSLTPLPSMFDDPKFERQATDSLVGGASWPSVAPYEFGLQSLMRPYPGGG